MQERVEILLLVALLFMLAMSVFSFVTLNKKIEGLQPSGNNGQGDLSSPSSVQGYPANGMVVVQIVNRSSVSPEASP